MNPDDKARLFQEQILQSWILAGIVLPLSVFLHELAFLDGRAQLEPHDVHALLRYDSE